MNVVIGLLLALAASFSATASEKTSFRFAYEDKAVMPFFAGDGEEIPAEPGVSVEMVLRLEKKIPSLNVELQRCPWKRCLHNLKNGEIDAVVASFRAERMDIGVFPMKDGKPNPALRMSSTGYALYKLKSGQLTWDGQALTNANGAIGFPRGYSIGDDLKTLGATVEESGSTLSDMKKLQLRRLDGVAAVESVGDYLIKQPSFGDIVKMEPTFPPKDYYLLLSHQFVLKNPELAQRIWRSMADIRERDLREILPNYLK